MAPTITRIESIEVEYLLEDVGTDEREFSLLYDPGTRTILTLFGLWVEINAGVTGEYAATRPHSSR